MRAFKLADTWISGLLILLFGCLTLLHSSWHYLIKGYFIVGAWQVISMLIHAFNGWFTQKGSTRRNYHWLVSIVIAMALLAFAVHPFAIIYLVMLFAAPFMALGYTIICHNELKKSGERPLDLFI
ncbi:MAG: hypothetical protein ABIR30_03315 [Chitinophagaceae bacterium]